MASNMLQGYFSVLDFGTVQPQSQWPRSQGLSFEQPETSRNKLQVPVPLPDTEPQLSDPNIKLFADSMIQLLKTSNAFGSFGTFLEYDPKEIILQQNYNDLN